MNSVPVHFVAKQLLKLVLSIILGFYVLPYCNIMLSFLAKVRIHGGKCSLGMPIFLPEK